MFLPAAIADPGIDLRDTSMSVARLDLANAIRALSMDAVEKANSGHPGAPMGMADIAEVLWNDFLRHNPGNPAWANRDRFVLSNGHGSMLLYSLLHLSGYDLPLEEIKRFRQLHSMTPGHPEVGHAPGVETTTGPLGQGLANAVGMAIAERTLAARFNRDGHALIDHFTYVFVGDGCLMEGVSHEVCSLAGTLGLGKLIVFYDDNGISIDGEVKGWFTDDTPGRFASYGWHVIPLVDGHQPVAIKKAIEEARADTQRPSLICCQTVIGWGSPNKQGKAACHGAALGELEVRLTREAIGWSHPPFVVPKELVHAWDARDRGARLEAEWNRRLEAYRREHHDLSTELGRRLSAELPADWSATAQRVVSQTAVRAQTIATRKASLNALNDFGPQLPELMGGSADLAGSNLTIWSGSKAINAAHPDGNTIYFGVREFGMAAIVNGIALHGGFLPYCATFLIFSEYARNALRMAALMKVPSIFVFTHDSIGLGEDGPTHQAVEQAATLRLIPNMSVWRPCDAVESAVAWKCAIERSDGPVSLLFSRQALAHQHREAEQIAAIERGAYVLRDCDGTPDAIVIATGSEVSLAMEAVKVLESRGRNLRVVSMPCSDRFDAQDAAYRESVLPDAIRQRIAIEAGVSDWWRKYVGLDGLVIGIDSFGESGPAADVFEHFGLTVEQVVASIDNTLGENSAEFSEAVSV
jgi:transketolase